MMTILACNEALRPIINLIKTIIRYIQIFVPILLILFGTIDLAQAVVSQDEKVVKEATTKFGKRLLMAAAVFFVVAIVQLVMGFVAETSADGSDTQSWQDCWNSN